MFPIFFRICNEFASNSNKFNFNEPLVYRCRGMWWFYNYMFAQIRRLAKNLPNGVQFIVLMVRGKIIIFYLLMKCTLDDKPLYIYFTELQTMHLVDNWENLKKKKLDKQKDNTFLAPKTNFNSLNFLPLNFQDDIVWTRCLQAKNKTIELKIIVFNQESKGGDLNWRWINISAFYRMSVMVKPFHSAASIPNLQVRWRSVVQGFYIQGNSRTWIFSLILMFWG